MNPGNDSLVTKLREGLFVAFTSMFLITHPAQTQLHRDIDAAIEKIHRTFMFTDMHAHPEQFHRANVSRISQGELNLYRASLIDLVVCSVSTDAPHTGGYTRRDSTVVPRLPAGMFYPLEPGIAFRFTEDRLLRILRTIDEGDAALAGNPTAVRRAKKRGKLCLMLALEGADGLEGKTENLDRLQKMGLRLLQLVHFRINALGHIQTFPFTPGGLTPFGEEIVRACNRLGIIIDLAHANEETTMDVLRITRHPVLFSHTGVKALQDNPRHLSDQEIRAIAGGGGVIGIWPSSSFGTMDEMVRHIDYVKDLTGIDHVGIGSDLRGMRAFPEFGPEADFKAVAAALLRRGYTDEDVGKVMGGNFFRVWEAVSRNSGR